ncbi:MAG TPA: hypothetical protein VFV31_02455, partial [Chitinophagaceae bacterium]|nr:hypothetical protein [Chitinophagaceae bacterium]
MWLVTLVFWLQAFAAPVILFGLIGFAMGNETAFYVLLAAGILTGIIVAAYIRRKIGLDTFLPASMAPMKWMRKSKT